jgi:hypothetical protein
MNRHWIKLWLSVLDDAKVGSLDDHQWRVMIECFLVAGEQANEGKLPTTAALAWRLRRDATELERIMDELASTGIVRRLKTGWRVTAFHKRQSAVSGKDRLSAARRHALETNVKRNVSPISKTTKRNVSQIREDNILKRKNRGEKKQPSSTAPDRYIK